MSVVDVLPKCISSVYMFWDKRCLSWPAHPPAAPFLSVRHWDGCALLQHAERRTPNPRF